MSYIDLYTKGILKKRAELLRNLLKECLLCPRKCGVNRLKNEKGFCSGGRKPVVSSYNLHFGEEPPISGYKGSGTIFFTYCNLKCCFCQNYPISQLSNGKKVEPGTLAGMMLELQQKGAHNINLVTPTHFTSQIVEALLIAIEKGLKIPIVYNCGGYESVRTLKLLDGIIDIYMPDAKYASSKNSGKYSNATDYFEVNRKALIEMYRQVGNLTMDKKGVAVSGLLIRHLVLPEDIAGSQEVLRFIAENISRNTYMSIMAQYHPAYKAYDFTQISRRITESEYDLVLATADRLGLKKGWRQSL